MLKLRITRWKDVERDWPTVDSDEDEPEKTDDHYSAQRKDFILGRQLEKCPVRIGDHIEITTNKGRRKGVVFELVSDPTKCKWRGGTQPYFIGVRCPLTCVIDGAELSFGWEPVYVPTRKVRM